MNPLKNAIIYLARLYCFVLPVLFCLPANAQLTAAFSATPVSGCAPLLVRFTDNSTGNPTSWNWDLGNGTVSTQKNPVTTYTEAGVYTIKLTVKSGNVSNTLTKNQYITVYDKPVVDFSVNDSIDCIPFTSIFSDRSTVAIGSMTSWQWNFDDGSSSGAQNPSHLYTTAGNYNITLKATSSGGCSSSLSKLAYIKANDSLRPAFTFTPALKCNPPELIRFTNNSTGPGSLSYRWDFGDGTFSTLPSPSHNYITGGTYTLQLTVSNNIGCRKTLVYRDTLRIRNVQTRIGGPDTVCTNTATNYVNATVPTALSSRWTFSDGGTAPGPSISKSWQTPGNYFIKLVSNFNTCSDSTTKRVTVVGVPPFNFSCNDTFGCRTPFTINFNDLSSGTVNWKWTFGDGDSSFQQNPSHTYLTEGIYTVRLLVTNSAGCTGNVLKRDFVRIHKPKINFNTGDGGGCIPYIFQPVPSVTAPDGITGYLWNFGNGTTSTVQYPSAVYADSGTYTVSLTVSSVNGCIDSSVVTAAVRTGNKPVVNFTGSPLSGCPETIVQFTDLSHPADAWAWSFGDGSSDKQNPTHRFRDSGYHYVRLIVTNNGCKDSLQINDYVKIAPGKAAFKAFYNCNNKKLVQFADSSQGAQSWHWNFGDGYTSTSQNPSHLYASFQDYTVVLTTTHDSCSSSDTLRIQLRNNLPDFISPDKNTCRNKSTGFFLSGIDKADVSSYLWDFGDGASANTGDSTQHLYSRPGKYTVSLSITHADGCTELVTKPDFIQVLAPHAGFMLNSTGGCAGKTVHFTDTSHTANGSNNLARWYWDFGDGTTAVYAPPHPAPLQHIYTALGNYYPSLVVADSAGCADTAFYLLPVRIGQPVADFFASNFATCTTDTVIIRNPSAGNGLHYLWSFGDGTFSSDSLPKKNYTVNGDYTMKLVVTDMFGCKDSLIKNNYIKVRDVKAIFRVSDSIGTCTPFKISCTNLSLNSTTQLWDFGDGGFSSATNPVYNYVNPGTYSIKLTARRSAYCFNTDSVKVIVNAPSGILTYAPLSGCAPLGVRYNVATTDSVLFIWNFKDGITEESNSSSIIHTYETPGSFIPSVLLLDTTAGCAINIDGGDTIRLFSSHINFRASDTLFCDSGTVDFSDSSYSGSAVTNYRWDFGDGTTSLLQHPSHFYATPGAYTIKLYLETAYGCRDSLIKTSYVKVAVKPDIFIAGNNNSYCGPATINFTGNLLSTDTSSITWLWNLDNGNNTTGQNPPSQTYTDTGSYTVILIADATNGCADTTFTTIRVLPLPQTNAGNDTAICAGQTAVLLASGADNYTWYPGAGLSCTGCTAPIFTGSSTSLVYVKGVNSFGCERTDSILVAVKKPFRVSVNNPVTQVCYGNTVTLQAVGAETYSWSPAAGLSNALIADPKASPLVNTLYTVTGADSIHCFTDTASVLIRVNQPPAVDAGTDETIAAGSTVTLAPRYSNDVTGILWQPSTALSCTTCPAPAATPFNSTTYTVTVTNSNGCTKSDSLSIIVKCDNSILYMPAAFVPESRNGNNYFCPLSPGVIKVSSFKVYNRTGQMIFQSGNFFTNDRSMGWDGKYKGINQPAGAYVYTLEFICANNQAVIKNGNFILIR